MKTPRDLGIESFAERLSKIDTVIIRNAKEGADLIRRRMSAEMVSNQVQFLRKLYERRDSIVHEAQRNGVTERMMYEEIDGNGREQQVSER